MNARFLSLAGAAALLVVAACSQEPAPAPEGDAVAADAEPDPNLAPQPAPAAAGESGTVALERGACFGPCPVYSVKVTADERLSFSGRKFTAKQGALEKTLPAGSFQRLLGVVRQHGFAAIDTGFPGEEGLDCPEPAVDMPAVWLVVDAEEIEHEIRFYEGCTGYPGDTAVIAMMREIDAALSLDDWIGPHTDFLGGKKP